jgi:hypothetical protein
VLNRINPVTHQRTRSAGLLSGFNEAHVGQCAETHVTRAAVQSKTVNPRSRAAWPYLQIETGAVVMQADFGERADPCFGDLLNEACHEIPLWAIPTFHGVHTLHAKICYALSCDMDAMEKIFTGTLSASVLPQPFLPGATAAPRLPHSYEAKEF